MTRIQIPPAAVPVMDSIAAAGGTPFLVGGAVRDAIMDHPSSDSDIEAHGLDGAELLRACFRVGSTNVVGQSFGVIKVDVPMPGGGRAQVDVSLPRRETKVGAGHTDFLPAFDRLMTVVEAASRRDFTVNSMLATREGIVIDPFNGQSDITRRSLRATSSATFGDDPLRVLRGVRFASQLGFTMEAQTAEICQGLAGQFGTLSAERVWTELWKWANGPHPGMGLQVLEGTGWLAAFPVLDALRNVEQDTEWHPELWAWEHTVQACEWAGMRQMGPIVVLAALLHDVGKATTTKVTEDHRITSVGHAEAGAKLALGFLERAVQGSPDRGQIIRQVPALVREHMSHATSAGPTPTAVRRLTVRLAEGGATIHQLALLAEADASGRHPAPPASPMLGWVAVAQQLGVASAGPLALVQGRDLIAAGATPGPHFGDVLRCALEAQLDGTFADTAAGVEWVLTHFNLPLLAKQAWRAGERAGDS